MPGMGGGLALRNLTSLQEIVSVLNGGTDVTTVANGDVIDRKSYGRDELLNNMRVLVALNFTTASGAANDEVDVTITVNQGDDAAGDDSVFATKTVSLQVDDDDEAKYALLTFDLDLVQAERYIMIDCLCAAGTGAPTVSVATASVIGVIMPSNDQPRTAYSKGAVETILFEAA